MLTYTLDSRLSHSLGQVPVYRQNDNQVRWRSIWLVSFASWMLLAVCYSLLRYKWMLDTGMKPHFWRVFYLPTLSYTFAAICTPGIYYLAHYYPVEQSRWKSRVSLHLFASLVFTLLHVLFRMATLAIIPMKDDYGHALAPSVRLVWQLFLVFTYDDALTTYWPIVVLVQMLDSHRRTRQKELQASQLEAELAKARLQNLKAQLQPHFLFNALNSISALMHVNVKTADTLISQLSALLRLSLDAANVQESTLREELEFVQGYLQIEQTRFSDRLSVEFEIEPETYDAKVPHMLLQPLVENAVRHGIAKRTLGGRITIRAVHTRDQLVISVSDNGCGFDLERVTANGTGVGLKNTRERLRKLYGNQQTFSATPVDGGGVQLQVSLPFVEMIEGTQHGLEDVPIAVVQNRWEGALHGNPDGRCG